MRATVITSIGLGSNISLFSPVDAAELKKLVLTFWPDGPPQFSPSTLAWAISFCDKELYSGLVELDEAPLE